MQAVGLRLEENGTVLALRGDGCASGTKWNCVPGNVLKRLNTAAKVSKQKQSVARAISVHRDPPSHDCVETFCVLVPLLGAPLISVFVPQRLVYLGYLTISRLSFKTFYSPT